MVQPSGNPNSPSRDRCANKRHCQEIFSCLLFSLPKHNCDWIVWPRRVSQSRHQRRWVMRLLRTSRTQDRHCRFPKYLGQCARLQLTAKKIICLHCCSFPLEVLSVLTSSFHKRELRYIEWAWDLGHRLSSAGIQERTTSKVVQYRTAQYSISKDQCNFGAAEKDP